MVAVVGLIKLTAYVPVESFAVFVTFNLNC